jgi:phosphoribosylformylglycinamidine synthase
VALAESCISQQIARDTPRLIGAEVDLSNLTPAPKRLDVLLFGETQARVIISTRGIDAVKVVERAKLLGVPAVKLGMVGGDKLIIRGSQAELSCSTAELYDLWWNAIARAMG